MTLVVTANVLGHVRGEPVRLPSRRRRLSTIVARHKPAGREVIVSVHRKGAEAYRPTDSSVRLRAQWNSTLVGPHDVVLLTVAPLGKGIASIGLAIASIALIAIAPYAAPAIAAGLTGVAVASTTATFAVQAGLVIGGLALGYAAQAAKGAGKSQRQAELYSVSGGGNVPKPGQRRPLLYGRCWSAPPLSQGDYFLYDGDTMVLTKRMTLGIGKFQVHRIRVGDALFWSESGGLQPPFNSTAAGNLGTAVEILYEQVSQLASGDVITSNSVSGQEMPRPGGNPSRTPWFRLTPQGVTADAALLSWTYPAVYRVSSSGRQVGTVSGVVFFGRKIDPTTGAVIGPEFEIQRSTELSDTFSPTPLRRSAYFRLPEPGSTYEICGQNAYPDPVGFEQQNRATWDGMSAYRDDYRVRPETTEIVLRIRAGKGLTVTAYSDVMVEATRIVPVWDGRTWTEQPTRKAVWAYCDLVRGTYGLAQPNGVDAAKALYYANLLTEHDTYDGLLPEVSSFWEAASQVLLPVRADPVKVGAVHSFVRDESRAEPRHILTRRQIVRDSSRATYKTRVEGGDVIVEFDRDGDPRRPDEVRYSYGPPTRTPKRYKVAGISNGLHALKHACWLAAIAVFRGAERQTTTEWDGRLIFPGDHILSDLWFLRGTDVYGVASANGTLLTLDVTANVPPTYGYGSIRTRQGREWGILRMRGVGARGLELHPDDVAALSAKTGLSLAAVLARDTQDPTTVVLGELVELQQTYVARSAIPSDPDHVGIEMVRDDPRVWQLLDEQVIAPAPIGADSLAEPLVPQISVLHARCQRVETGIEVVYGVSATAGARAYEFEISYDGGATWEVLSALGPASSGRAQMRQVDRPVTVRARAYGRTGLHGDWITTTFTTVAPVVSGALVDIKTLPPIAYENLDTVIQGRIDQIDAIKDEAEAAAKTAADALAAASDRADAALAAAEQMAADALAAALIDIDRVRKALAFDPSIRQANVDPIIADFRADVDILTQAVTRNLQEVAALRDALSTAGLEMIPQEGRVRFYAIEALQTSVSSTISNFSITVDALSKKIDLYGSVQNSDLSGLINSISTVRTTLDALQGTITNLATVAEFNAVAAKVTTVETKLDAQAGEIALRATRASVDDQGTRLTTAEQRISAAEGRISQSVQASTGGAVDLTMLPQTLSSFFDLIQRQQGAFQQTLGFATQNIAANIDEAGRVTAEVRTDLGAFKGDATAQFTSITRAIADTNSAVVTTQSLLEARFTAAQASISAEAAARADADAAQTTQYAAAVSRIGAAEAAITSEAKTRARADEAQTTQTSAAVSRIGAAEAALVSEATTRASADEAQTSQITAAVSRIGIAEAALVSEAKTRASADEAQTTQISAALSRLGAAEASITSEATTRASADAAQTSQIAAAVSRLGAAEAAITSEASTRATADSAQAQRVDGLTAAVGANTTNITNLNVALANDRDVNATSIRNLDARVGSAEGGVATALSNITTVETVRAQTDSALSSRIDTLVSRVGSAEANLVQESLTRASLDEAIGKYVAAVDTKVDGVNAGVALETQSRVAGDAANAAQITDLYARSDAGTALGRFAMTAISAPGGVSVRLAMQASTESYGQRRNAGLFLDLLPDGNSRLVIDANTFAITANGGVTYPFVFDGQTLTIPSLRVTNSALIPGAVSQSDWAYNNDYIVEFQVNCRPNSRISVIAMFDGKPATGITLGQTGNLEILRDGILLRRTPVSFYVAGNNENRLAFTLNTTTFVRDTPGAGVHTYRVQCTAFQGPVSAIWEEFAA